MYRILAIKAFAIFVGLPSLVLSSALKTSAQMTASFDFNCRSAIENVKQKIAKTPGGLRVVSLEPEANESPFQDAPLMLKIVFTGKGHSNLMNSPVFAKSLAKEIIMSCQPISSVLMGPVQPHPSGVGFVGSGYDIVFGSIGYRENVVFFECPKWHRNRDILPWGKHCMT